MSSLHIIIYEFTLYKYICLYMFSLQEVLGSEKPILQTKLNLYIGKSEERFVYIRSYK